MENYKSIFYSTKLLDLKTKLALLDMAYKKCYSHHIDILDCSVSVARQRTDMGYAEIIRLLDESAHFVVIERNQFGNHFGDVGFSVCTAEKPFKTHFLFLELKPEDLFGIIEHFKLEEL